MSFSQPQQPDQCQQAKHAADGPVGNEKRSFGRFNRCDKTTAAAAAATARRPATRRVCFWETGGGTGFIYLTSVGPADLWGGWAGGF